MEPQKPKCACGKEMIVVEYVGYYDSFKYWKFHDECECPNVSDVGNFTRDSLQKGAYA